MRTMALADDAVGDGLHTLKLSHPVLRLAAGRGAWHNARVHEEATMYRMWWLLAALVACGGESTDPTEETDTEETDAGDSRVSAITALNGSSSAGAGVYSENCALCHAADGTGGTGTDLTATLPGLAEEDAILTILDGVEGTTMTSWDGFLSEQEIADVVAYIYETFGS